MSIPRSPRARVGARETLRLQDLTLENRDKTYRVPGTGDWLWLVLLSIILLGNGAYIWHQRGLHDRIGLAVFVGLLLLALYWSALVYVFKLSLAVRVGPKGLSLTRGPWSTELAWSEIGRLTERISVSNGRRYRWVAALARDGRKLQMREDMVLNYAQFRIEVYERYRLWRDHGAATGVTGDGKPFTANESVAADVLAWSAGSVAALLPGIYFTALLFPETGVLGPLLLVLALACIVLDGRSYLRRAAYTIDAKALEMRRPFRAPLRLPWREITRVDRQRSAFNIAIRVGVLLGRAALALAGRTDARYECFAWTPRAPDYLILRGGGHQVRIRLHRLAHPDELLAWVEFYERLAQRKARNTANLRRSASQPLPSAEVAGSRPALTAEPSCMGEMSGPLDPRDGSREGEIAAPSGIPAPLTPTDGGMVSALKGRGTGAMRPEGLDDLATPGALGRAPLAPPARTSATPAGFASAQLDAVNAAIPTVPSPALEPPSEPATGEFMAPLPPQHDAPPPVPAGEPYRAQPTWTPPREPWERTELALPAPQTPFSSSPSASSAPGALRASSASQASQASPPSAPPPAASRPRWPAQEEIFQPATDEADDWSEGDDALDEDAPTAAVESLAESFAPWREQNWSRPPLPRFGPPSQTGEG